MLTRGVHLAHLFRNARIRWWPGLCPLGPGGPGACHPAGSQGEHRPSHTASTESQSLIQHILTKIMVNRVIHLTCCCLSVKETTTASGTCRCVADPSPWRSTCRQVQSSLQSSPVLTAVSGSQRDDELPLLTTGCPDQPQRWILHKA